jgi:hypothetical protein
MARRASASKRVAPLFGLLALAVLAITPATAQAPLSDEQIGEIAQQGVAFGLPLVLMDLTRQVRTNAVEPGPYWAPVNQLVQNTEYHVASYKVVVRSNVDSLYTMAWLNLKAEPIVLSVPETHGRFYLFQMLDMWSDVFASPGTRTTGSDAGHFAIVGPDWSGTLPAGVKEIRAPTNDVWLIAPTQTNGPADYAAVHAIQARYRLTPLASLGRPYTPPRGVLDPTVDMQTPPVQQVAKLGGGAFLARLALLMTSNRPRPDDAPMLARLARIGCVPGQPFDTSRLSPAAQARIEEAVRVVLARLSAPGPNAHLANGWSIPPAILGNFGTNYAVRAQVALVGLAANLPADTIYPTAYVDADGQGLSGAKRYVLHFDKDQLPPANAFWSVTMYTPDSFFVPNAIDRYALSSWMPLTFGADGSLDLYLQKDPPDATLRQNWLPAPDGAFNVTMRLYWPRPEALDGRWVPPGIRELK